MELARVLAETLMITINTNCYNSDGVQIRVFPLPKWGGTSGLINNVCRLLRAVMGYYELTDCYLTKTMVSATCFSDYCWHHGPTK